MSHSLKLRQKRVLKKIGGRQRRRYFATELRCRPEDVGRQEHYLWNWNTNCTNGLNGRHG